MSKTLLQGLSEGHGRSNCHVAGSRQSGNAYCKYCLRYKTTGFQVNVPCGLTALPTFHLNSTLRLVYSSSKYLLNVSHWPGPEDSSSRTWSSCRVSVPAGRQAVLTYVMDDCVPGALAESTVCRQESTQLGGTQSNWDRPPGQAA